MMLNDKFPQGDTVFMFQCCSNAFGQAEKQKLVIRTENGRAKFGRPWTVVGCCEWQWWANCVM